MGENMVGGNLGKNLIITIKREDFAERSDIFAAWLDLAHELQQPLV